MHDQRDLDPVFGLELGQQPRDVRLDGGDAHVQFGGDVGVRLPAADRQGYLALARAERGEPLSGGLLARGGATVAGDEGVPTRRVDAMLDRVGLDRGAARKRVRQYSLGMRQRLGLAHALLGDPEVLILDEPANGLDPEGMRWMRELLRDFADRGGTVLLSSHLLREVQATVDRLVIIGDGRIVAQGTTKDLLSGVGTLVVADDESGLMAALAATDLAARTLPDGGLMVDAEPEAVGRAALDGGVALSHLGPSEGHDLEQLFFDLTAGSEAPPAEPVEAAR